MIGILSSNALKIIALICMTFDHLGKEIFPDMLWMQIIGRLSLPIFSYMIAEGCYYTKHKGKYIGTIGAVALLCQIVYFVAEKSLYQCILVTFSLSILLIYTIDYIKKKRNIISILSFVIVFSGIFYLCNILPRNLSEYGFFIDYGIFGVLLPVFIYIGRTKEEKLAMAGIGMIFLAKSFGGIQWYSLISLILLLLYNGKRGRLRLKYLFYIYYPLHLAAIYGLSMII